MELFLNYNPSFLKVKDDYEHLRHKNEEWRAASYQILDDIAVNNSGKWSDTYMQKAREVIDDYNVFCARIDKMCETLNEADMRACQMITTCNRIPETLGGGLILQPVDGEIIAYGEMEKEGEIQAMASCLPGNMEIMPIVIDGVEDIMYNEEYHDPIMNHCNTVTEMSDEELETTDEMFKLLGDELTVFSGKMGKYIAKLHEDIELMKCGVHNQRKIEDFQDAFIVYVNQVNDFNTNVSTMFTDVCGDWKEVRKYDGQDDHGSDDGGSGGHHHHHHDDDDEHESSGSSGSGNSYSGYSSGAGSATAVGANQSFMDYVHGHAGFENATTGDVQNFMSKNSANGFDASAMANGIFNSYKGKEDEFRKKYGFNMYDENGNLNYQQLLFDIFYNTQGDEQASFEDRFSKYCAAHGDMVDSTDLGDSLEKSEFTDAGAGKKAVYVEGDNLTLCKEDGTPMGDNKPVKGNFVVTDMLGEGKYKVSSLGQNFIIDNKASNGLRFKSMGIMPDMGKPEVV